MGVIVHNTPSFFKEMMKKLLLIMNSLMLPIPLFVQLYTRIIEAARCKNGCSR